jgi:hypothetical protein
MASDVPIDLQALENASHGAPPKVETLGNLRAFDAGFAFDEPEYSPGSLCHSRYRQGVNQDARRHAKGVCNLKKDE